jgi:hypothetical protein
MFGVETSGKIRVDSGGSVTRSLRDFVEKTWFFAIPVTGSPKPKSSSDWKSKTKEFQ